MNFRPLSTRITLTCCLSLSLAMVCSTAVAQNIPDNPASSSSETPNEFVPLQAGQTLPEIAEYLMPDDSVTLEQTILALFVKNPLQFTENNINGLVTEPRLLVPSIAEIRAINHQQAKNTIAQHHQIWADKTRTRAASLTQRPEDDQRPDEQFTVQWLNRPLTIGGKIETELRYREDLSLSRRDDDDLRHTLGLQLEFLYRLSPNTSLYVEVDPSYEADLYAEDDDTETSSKIELGELWLHMGGFGNQHLSVQIGRQYFGDQREWWWDEKLDAVRVQYDDDAFNAQFAIGANPISISTDKNDDLDPENENITWLLASADWEWSRKNHLEAFLLSRFDHSATPAVGDIVSAAQEDESDAAINWFGLRSRGRLKVGDLGRIDYWLDSGVVYGKETLIGFDDIGNNQSEVDERRDRTLNGWGFDIGATWDLQLPYEPRLSLGYAKGSGDANPDDGMDRSYRQSGLQSNDDKFRGVNSVKYYGELLRPELSNLNVFTLALGFPLLKDSSVELVYHRYSQIYATDQLRSTRLRTDPEGRYRDIGEEFNIILGLEEWEQLELELIAAQFRSGKAYGVFSGRTASTISLDIQYSF